MRNSAALKKSATGRLALISAGLGILVGGTHELWEALFHNPEEETLGYMLMEVAAAAAIGTLVFVCASMLWNCAAVRKGSMRKPPRKNWDPIGFCLCGAFVGTMLVLVHEIHEIALVRFPQADPFLHIMAEMSLLAISNAVLFAGVAIVRNGLMQTSFAARRRATLASTELNCSRR
jgi:hypothetical protein